MAIATAAATISRPSSRLAKPTSSPAILSVGNTKISRNSAAAAVTHLSCCRSSPRERRKRMTSDVADASIPTSRSTNPSPPITWTGTSRAPSTPSGFSIGYSSRCPGAKAMPTKMVAQAATATHTSGRQRGVSGNPDREQQWEQDQCGDHRGDPDPTRQPRQELRHAVSLGVFESNAPVDVAAEDQQSKGKRDRAQDPAIGVARLPRGHDRPDHAEQDQDQGFERRHRDPTAGHKRIRCRRSTTPGRRSRARGEPPRASRSRPHAVHAMAPARRLITARVSQRLSHPPRVILAAHLPARPSGMRYETVTTATIVAPWRSRSRCWAPRGSNGTASG